MGSLATRPRPFARQAGGLLRPFAEPERPSVAIEVRPTAVGVVRVRRDRRRVSVAAASAMDLPPGTLALSLTQANVADPDRFRQALRGALERAGVLGGARVALVLPDTAARVALVPAVEVPSKKPAEIQDLLRFRLRKSLPFEVRDARIAYAAPGDRPNDAIVVAAAAAAVVDGYEGICRSLGLAPGLVEVAGVALARVAFPTGSTGDGLLLNWDEGYLTLMLARDGWPILVRTLAGSTATSASDALREVSSTLVYYRERLGGSGLAGAFVRSTAFPPDEAADALAAAIGFVPAVLDAWTGLGGAPPEASQALAGAAAVLGAPA